MPSAFVQALSFPEKCFLGHQNDPGSSRPEKV
jgi:hypothetical protein